MALEGTAPVRFESTPARFLANRLFNPPSIVLSNQRCQAQVCL